MHFGYGLILGLMLLSIALLNAQHHFLPISVQIELLIFLAYALLMTYCGHDVLYGRRLRFWIKIALDIVTFASLLLPIAPWSIVMLFMK